MAKPKKGDKHLAKPETKEEPKEQDAAPAKARALPEGADTDPIAFLVSLQHPRRSPPPGGGSLDKGSP